MPAQQCIQGRADRRNLASAPLIPTRSPDPAPTTTKSSRLDGFCHPLHHGQIAIARGPFRTSTPRGFLPWTVSDDDPGAFPRWRNGPSSETLHKPRRPRAIAIRQVFPQQLKGLLATVTDDKCPNQKTCADCGWWRSSLDGRDWQGQPPIRTARARGGSVYPRGAGRFS
jgi:hypothetical protein